MRFWGFGVKVRIRVRVRVRVRLRKRVRARYARVPHRLQVSCVHVVLVALLRRLGQLGPLREVVQHDGARRVDVERGGRARVLQAE